LGYLTLGILIHKVTGEFYGDFLQQRIFRPLGMTTTRIMSEADIIPDRSAGYRLVNGEVKNQEWVSPSVNTTADGSLYFSILDLAKWDAALYTDRLLTKSSLRQMWTVAPLRNGQPNSGHYGYGWFIESQDGHRLIEHARVRDLDDPRVVGAGAVDVDVHRRRRHGVREQRRHRVALNLRVLEAHWSSSLMRRGMRVSGFHTPG